MGRNPRLSSVGLLDGREHAEYRISVHCSNDPAKLRFHDFSKAYNTFDLQLSQ